MKQVQPYLSYFLIVTTALLCGLRAGAQVKDTTEHVPAEQIRAFTPDRMLDYKPIDTTLEQFHQYLFLDRNDEFYAYLGNPGTAYHPFTFRAPERQRFSLGFRQFERYRLQNRDITYYHTPTPLSDLSYVNGAQNEHLLQVLHTQNAHDNYNFAIRYNRQTAGGYYNNQKTLHSNFAINNWYRSSNQRYNLLASMIVNNSEVNENGGVAIENFTEEPTLQGKQRLIIPIQVQGDGIQEAEAFNHWNDIKGYLSQSYDGGAYREEMIDDTTSYFRFFPTWRARHEAEVSRTYYRYYDNLPASGFYENVYLDSLQTNDSIFHFRLANTFTFSTLPVKGLKNDSMPVNRNHTLDASLFHAFHRVNRMAHDGKRRTTEQQELRPELRWQRHTTPQSRFGYHLRGSYSLIDYNRGDYLTGGGIRYMQPYANDSIAEARPGTHRWEAGLTLRHQQYMPDWIQSVYYGNHFEWRNHFNKIASNTARLHFRWPRRQLEVSLSGHLFRNFVYYDTKAQPQQYGAPLQSLVLQTKKHFTWRKWNLHTVLTLQRITPEQGVVHLPELWTRNTLFYEREMFNEAVRSQFGFDIYYRNPFMANNYLPATGQFYLQEGRVMVHPFVLDFFINARIKTARVFFKITYLNQGLGSNAYYNVRFHPMPSNSINVPPFRTYKVGAFWRLYE